MRIIVAGAGEVGTHLAKLLSSENHEIVIIDSDGRRLGNLAATCDLLTLRGDVTSRKLLMEAGTDKADLFIAVTTLEDTNIISAIMAKKLGAKLTVVRIGTSEQLYRETRDIYTDLGIDSFIYPEKIAAREITNSLHQSGISTNVEFSGGRLSLLAVKIDKNALIINKTVREIDEVYKTEYRTVAILRNGKTIIPDDDDHYEPNDTVYMIATPANIKNILRCFGEKNDQISQVMILGGSHIGRLTAKELGKSYNIKIFESDKEEAYRLSDTLNNAMVIHGDGTKVDLLLEEGLRTTDAFIAVTGSSEANILACMLAKSEGVKRTIAEIENLDYINLAERMGIDTIINKKLIAAGHIYRYTLMGSVTMIKYLTIPDSEVLEFVVSSKSKITERPLCKIDFPKNAVIGGIVRKKVGYIAISDIWIQPGDHVIVFAMQSAISKVTKLF